MPVARVNVAVGNVGHTGMEKDCLRWRAVMAQLGAAGIG